jgi:hypothetical protein
MTYIDLLNEQLRRIQVDATLASAIHTAEGVPAPIGYPRNLQALADAYRHQAKKISDGSIDDTELVKQKLAAGWRDSASRAALSQLESTLGELRRIQDALNRIATILERLAMEIDIAMSEDERGRKELRLAVEAIREILPRDLASPSPQQRAQLTLGRRHAHEGIGLRLAAATRSTDHCDRAERDLHELADEARLARLAGLNVPDATKLELIEAAMPGNGGEILTPSDLSRVGQRLAKMSAADQAAYQTLLAGAKSEEERAYITKAVAAGHTMKEVAAFDKLIHAHGDDPAWLSQHLSPIQHNTAKVQFEQGQGNCASAATVTARAHVDPVYALYLTTGNHPDDKAYDNPAAAQARYEAERDRTYKLAGSFAEPGVKTSGEVSMERVTDQQLGAPLGVDYQATDVRTPEQRREVLERIERAVDEGRPVPLMVSRVDEHNVKHTHEVVVVGHDGDRLQVYNPWGTTTWVSEKDFLDDHMNKAGSPHPKSLWVMLPK